jgi:hypothetical protein
VHHAVAFCTAVSASRAASPCQTQTASDQNAKSRVTTLTTASRKVPRLQQKCLLGAGYRRRIQRVGGFACILSALPSGRKTMNACGIPNWTGSVISPERHVYVAVDNADALLPASTRAV